MNNYYAAHLHNFPIKVMFNVCLGENMFRKLFTTQYAIKLVCNQCKNRPEVSQRIKLARKQTA